MAESSLRRKAGIVVLSRLLTALIDMGTGIALLRLLPKGDFAVMAFVLLVYQTAQYLATLGFPDSVFYFFERIAPGARRRFAWQTTGIVSAAAVVAAVLIIVVSFVAPLFLTAWTPEQIATTQRFLPLVALVALLEIPTWPVNNLMLALDRARDAAWYQVVTSVMTFAALVVPLALGYGVEWVVWGLLMYAALRLVLSAAWMLAALPPSTEPLPPGLLREQIRFALPLGINGLASRLNRQQDRYIVSSLLPAERLAEYTAGATELPLVTVVPNALGTVLISRFVRFQLEDRKDELISLWYRSIEKTTLLVVPIGVFFIAAARDFVPMLAGAEYTAAVLPFQLFTLVVLHRVTSYGTMLQAFGDTRGVLRITLALLVVNVLLSVPLTLWLGIAGTALGTVFANAFSWQMALRRIGRHMGLPARRVLPFPFYLRTLGVSGLCGLLVYGLRSVWSTGTLGVDFAVSATVFVLLFAAAGTVAGVIGRAEWRGVARALRLR